MNKKFDIKKYLFPAIGVLIASFGIYYFSSYSKQTVDQYSEKSVETVSKSIVSSYPKEIVGNIVTLKLLSLDCAFEYHNMFSDVVRKAFEFPENMTFGEVEYQIKEEIKEMNNGIMLSYTIWDNKDNNLVGNIQIREKSSDHPGQLSMWLNENYWGGGRIQEAMLLISKAYFKSRPNTKSYNAYVREWNIRSAKSMEKFGFVRTGESRKNGKLEHLVYEITRESIESR